jgi:hypothetical protein
MEEETLLRFDEAARMLGMKVATLRDWRLSEQMPVVIVGRRSVRIPLSWIRQVIRNGMVAARGDHDRGR